MAAMNKIMKIAHNVFTTYKILQINARKPDIIMELSPPSLQSTIKWNKNSEKTYVRCCDEIIQWNDNHIAEKTQEWIHKMKQGNPNKWGWQTLSKKVIQIYLYSQRQIPFVSIVRKRKKKKISNLQESGTLFMK